ncbi:MAG: hypothetical protein FJX59_08640 [Alphaproteobacteria bacterium]|nr:hypothetical protein [Alphaproteobacteria bacterium]
MVHSAIEQVRIAGATVPRATLRGIQVASADSGVNFQYLLAKAAQESSFDADAGAKTSSAKGLFQFTKGTWLGVVKRHADELGLGELASRILGSPGQQLRVLDKTTEDKLLGLRSDPEMSARAAAAFARDNALALEGALGRAPDAPDLYLAHFLGAKGATQMLSAADDAPNIYAAHLMPAAARANPAVFYGPSGAPRTVADVVGLIRDRFETQLDKVSDVAAALASEDTADAVELDHAHRAAPTPPATTPAAPSLFDFKSAMARGDTDKVAVNWFVLEQLAKLIAEQPMNMAEEDQLPRDETALSARGFSGDWASILTNSYLDDAGLTGSSAAAATRVSRAYTHLAPRR